MQSWLKTSIAIAAVLLAACFYLDWLWHHDAQGALLLGYPVLAVYILTPINLVACVVFLIKSNDEARSQSAFWVVLLFATIATIAALFSF